MAETASASLSSKFMKSSENLINTNNVKKVEEIRHDHVKPENIVNKSTISKQGEDDCEPELRTPGLDPRFQQQNQTLRCFVMYTDFYRCEHILGEGADACSWFKEVYSSICPNHWISQWDDLRVRGVLPWHKHRTQGDFPGTKYGE